ncbi:flagellar hook protein FlgE [Sphingomonas radiodurans]|uniref:flagellar hook protein FlgE n=1 Tax=Sphingomonas radiodurans TaxID=2890321 RepID=UPI001E4C7B55|nr:flagellar hook protein FlgE [Sphingomonas radiodurans]WBH15650.1 flagellar hook protein FlgE [Sphingomonas radiodurans]
MSFYTSLSGLQAAQTDMSTISHNLANVSSNGFKKSRSEFTDIMASNFTTDPRRMVGSGTALAQNKQQFGEGSLITTGSSLDVAVSGEGFFAVKAPNASGSIAYTRNGSFTVDPNRYITDAQGSRLQAYAVETDGTVPGQGTLIDVRVPETTGTAKATSTMSLKANLNTSALAPAEAFSRASPATYNNSTSTTVFDAAGNPQTLTNYFVRKAPAEAASTASEWSVYSFVGDQPLNEGNPNDVTFDSEGNLTSGANLSLAFPDAGDATRAPISLDLTGSSAAKQAFSIASRTQDGQSLGEFSGITVDSAGVITASYSNGDAVKLGKVALATFVNPTGLKQNGGNYWTSTGLSGTATMGSANENGFGKLMSGMVEGSNVDITEELVELISAQRNFQANAKALDTASQISQTIFNIRA